MPGPSWAAGGRKRHTPHPRPSGAERAGRKPHTKAAQKKLSRPSTGRTEHRVRRPFRRRRGSAAATPRRRPLGRSAATGSKPYRQRLPTVPSGHIISLRACSSTQTRRLCPDGTPSETIPMLLFDRRAWRLHRDRAARGGCTDFLHAEVADRLIDRLDDVPRQFRTALDLGAHNGAVARALGRRPGIELMVAADPSLAFLAGLLGGLRVAAEPDLVPFREASFDLAVSALALHWVGDLPGALIQLRRMLKPGGLFLAAMFGGSTLIELRTVLLEAELIEEGGASPRVSPAAEAADVAALLLRTGFAMPVADAERITVTYPDALVLMRDLRGMGETNALSERRRTPLRRLPWPAPPRFMPNASVCPMDAYRRLSRSSS